MGSSVASRGSTAAKCWTTKYDVPARPHPPASEGSHRVCVMLLLLILLFWLAMRETADTVSALCLHLPTKDLICC